MVKRIFLEYLEGYSYNIIRKGLEADGIKTAACKTKFVATTLHKILRNEKYIGDALLQKTVTTDFWPFWYSPKRKNIPVNEELKIPL